MSFVEQFSIRSFPIVCAGLAVSVVLSTGCTRHLVYVSDEASTNQIRTMEWTWGIGGPNPSSQPYSNSSPRADSYPNLSPDTTRLVFSAELQSGDFAIVTRDLSDTTGSSETVLLQSGGRKIWPRWSCQQDLIAYADYGPGAANQASLFVVRSDGSQPPVQVSFPPSGVSDSSGHDFVYQGNALIHSRRTPQNNTYDLYLVPSDGSGVEQQLTNSATSNEVLPVTSHDGRHVAYVSYVKLAPGWPELVTVADVDTWAAQHQFQFQPAIGDRKISAIAFSEDDDRLYIATKSADVTAPAERDKVEIFSVTLDGSDSVRLTDNVLFDSYPDAIPKDAAPPCQRCIDVESMPETGPTQRIVRYGVNVHAAVLPSGTPSSVAVTDYCPTGDGRRELEMGWSQSDSGSGRYARIEFPASLFGNGPSQVEITACHYNAMTAVAYDSNGNQIASVEHTAGQSTVQTLVLTGAGIARIDVIGAEIGISDICYQ